MSGSDTNPMDLKVTPSAAADATATMVPINSPTSGKAGSKQLFYLKTLEDKQNIAKYFDIRGDAKKNVDKIKCTISMKLTYFNFRITLQKLIWFLIE